MKQFLKYCCSPGDPSNDPPDIICNMYTAPAALSLCPAKYPELAMQFARMLIVTVPRSCAEPGRCIRKVHVLFCESCFMYVAQCLLQLLLAILLLHCAAPRSIYYYTIQHFSQSNRLVADLQSRKRIGPDQSSLGHCLKKCSLFLAPKLLVYQNNIYRQ